MFSILNKNKHLSKLYKSWKRASNVYKYSSCAINFKTKDEVLGYSVKKVEEISELNLTAILLEHKATGAEHLHLACNDSNNLFSVSFRTPPTSSNGVPHILEHLALCGSQRFPCRDPFFNMLTRSLSTFMNAFTSPDSTMYAFSSQNQTDFQNLLSVYLDASFFPLLTEIDFRQEGWRLEHENVNDKSSPIIFKGVVFNEMKGVYSDPSSYFYYNMQKRLFPNHTYSHISGGEPMAIPTLSWEGLKRFHSHHYHPSNSRFITYGNMPLETHLEQIEDKVLRHFNKLEIENEVPDMTVWTKPREDIIYNKFDPLAAIPEKQTIVSESFLLDKITNTNENFALSILGSLLVDGPNAPFYQKLLESGIGPDFSPVTGYINFLKHSVFSVGLREIAQEDINKVKDIIQTTFDEVINTGFPDKQIQALLHNIEIKTKHRTSKFGLSCAMGLNSMWNHDGCPVSALQINNHVQFFLKQMSDNPRFLQDKVYQYFKANKHQLTLVMTPKTGFEQELVEEERNLLSSKLSSLTEVEKNKLFEKGIELLNHQQHVDPSCLPTLKIEDVSKHIERTPLKFTELENIPVQLCEQPTNEVTYFNAMFDVSDLSEKDIMLLPLFCSIITQMGAGSRNYKELDQEIQLKTAGLNFDLHLSENPTDNRKFTQNIHISSYCLDRNTRDMFSLWKDIFLNVHLEDVDRLSQLIKLNASDLAQSITHNGHKYAVKKACSGLTACAAIREKTSGIAQINFMKKLAEKEDHTDTLEDIKRLAHNILNKELLRASLNSTHDTMPSALHCLESFIKYLVFKRDYISESNKKSEIAAIENYNSHFILPSSVNFLGKSILTVPFCHPDYASLKIASRLLASKFLHAEIREKGGAYGGGSALNQGGHFTFYSYRDPNVDRTLESFSSGIKWLIDGTYSDQDIDEAKLSVFSEIDAPVSPGAKGQLFFQEEISDEMKETLRLHIFDCKKENLIEAAKKYLMNTDERGSALIGPEIKDPKRTSSWKIIS